MRDDGYFDEAVAARYDAQSAAMFSAAKVEPVVGFLAALAGDGAALEFGIGTGRIALSLAARGVPVQGIELSRAMAERLRLKPGGEEIPLTIGEFSTAAVSGGFAVVYLVFNTIMNLTTQEAQVRCFENAARHLRPGGAFVIETMLPDLQRLPAGETIRPFEVRDSHWGFDEYDVANQGLVSHHLTQVDGELRRSSIPFRYVWPSELDLMARIAGLTAAGRWSGWQGEPFTSESRDIVAIWLK